MEDFLTKVKYKIRKLSFTSENISMKINEFSEQKSDTGRKQPPSPRIVM